MLMLELMPLLLDLIELEEKPLGGSPILNYLTGFLTPKVLPSCDRLFWDIARMEYWFKSLYSECSFRSKEEITSCRVLDLVAVLGSWACLLYFDCSKIGPWRLNRCLDWL